MHRNAYKVHQKPEISSNLGETLYLCSWCLRRQWRCSPHYRNKQPDRFGWYTLWKQLHKALVPAHTAMCLREHEGSERHVKSCTNLCVCTLKRILESHFLLSKVAFFNNPVDLDIASSMICLKDSSEALVFSKILFTLATTLPALQN